MVRNYTSKELLDRVASLKGFTHIPYLLLIAVRSKNDLFNQFDDKFYFFVNGVFFARTTGTTNPGSQSLLGGWRKVNKRGSAIIKADEIYYDAYRYGLHQGKMPALRQVKPILTHRDNDNDERAEELGVAQAEIAFTNFHFADYNIYSRIKKTLVGGWSHGCIVANESEGYVKIIDKAKQEKLPVTLALLKEF